MVDALPTERLLGADVLAREDERERVLGAHDARQALRALGAGKQADGDLGQAELGRVSHDAEVAAERELKPAAERKALDARNGRHGQRLEGVDDFGQGGVARLFSLFGAAEARDVSAGAERARAGAAEHDGADGAGGRVGVGAV